MLSSVFNTISEDKRSKICTDYWALADLQRPHAFKSRCMNTIVS